MLAKGRKFTPSNVRAAKAAVLRRYEGEAAAETSKNTGNRMSGIDVPRQTKTQKAVMGLTRAEPAQMQVYRYHAQKKRA